jgi:hypothetical protein
MPELYDRLEQNILLDATVGTDRGLYASEVNAPLDRAVKLLLARRKHAVQEQDEDMRGGLGGMSMSKSINDAAKRIFQPDVNRRLALQLGLARAPHSESFVGAEVGLPEFWASRIARFVALRDSGVRRQLKLSRGAESELSTYAREVGRHQSKQRCWLRRASITAAKIAVVLHAWNGGTADEISEKTMRAAIELTRWLAIESSAAACAYATGEQNRQLREAGEIMLEKLKSLVRRIERPVTRRELYRTYDDESRKLRDPSLEFLLRTGQVRWVQADRLDIAAETPGKSYDARAC